MSLGAEHSLLVNADGSVWAAGGNPFGQMGTGSRTDPKVDFVQVLSGVVNTVAADGGGHSMVLKQDGSVWATGRNQHGQLGDGSKKDRFKFLKVIASGVQAVAVGSQHSLVVKEDGIVWVTGSNMNGQLGNALITGTRKFSKVSFIGAEAVAAGVEHSLIRGQDGSVWAVGGNDSGQLGDDTKVTKGTFVQVLSSGAKAIAAGGYHSMVLKQDGTVWAMGDNKYGQLGDGSTTSRKSMLRVTNDFMQYFSTGAKAIAAGFLHSMVLQEDGTVWATGRNDHGQLGDGSKLLRNSFVQVTNGAQGVAAGGWHSAVLKVDGSFWTAGANSQGQLGDGSTMDKNVFVKVVIGQHGDASKFDKEEFFRVAQANDNGAWSIVPGRTLHYSVCSCFTCLPGRLYRLVYFWFNTHLSTEASTMASIPEIHRKKCPKCDTMKKSGKLSCCARGGAWFQNCGDTGKPNFEHTWAEGIQACTSECPTMHALLDTHEGIACTHC